MRRVKTDPNLRQQYRELLERAQAVGIRARLHKGYLYYADDLSSPQRVYERELWASKGNLCEFQNFVELAERLAEEKAEVGGLLDALCKTPLGSALEIDAQYATTHRWWFKCRFDGQSFYFRYDRQDYQRLFAMVHRF